VHVISPDQFKNTCFKEPPKRLGEFLREAWTYAMPFRGAHLSFAPAAPQHICLHLRQLLSGVWRTAPIRSV